MSFAHFNEINEICNGMLGKEKTAVKMKTRMKKRYVIKSRPLTQEQLLEDAEEEKEKEGEKLYVYRLVSPIMINMMGICFCSEIVSNFSKKLYK